MMYHRTVLLKEAVELLGIRPEGTYVDATFGSGGHSTEILNQLKEGHLIAFDQDQDALQNTLSDSRFTLIPQNFKYLRNFLKAIGITSVDGILADLGISSWQIDQPERGFSTRLTGKLDMRMDKSQDLNASSIVNGYEERELADLFYTYGEITNSRALARQIIKRRSEKQVESTTELAALALEFAPKGKENQYLARVFQAIRIEGNQELDALKELMLQSTDLLKQNGRLVIISYHSLEDKLVKNYFNTGNFDGKPVKDFYGNLISPFKPVIRKAIRPSEKEIDENPRSRSARMRAAIKK
jgi:16S rRNA (cytosine1402-N4)-methyltransferase